jgi:predicted ATP-grasp superfamily ATP-dependent carboligase
MQVFVYEYLSSGVCPELASIASVRTEGWAMLAALLEDFGRCLGVQTVALVDPTLPARFPNLTTRCVAPEEEEAIFRGLARAADYSVVIAPEWDNLLATRCRWVEEEGGQLLGPCSAAVRLTADKLACACCLRDHGVPTPETFLASSEADIPAQNYPLVYKPRDGAGSQATFLVHDPRALRECKAQAREEGWQGEMILQSYVPGRAVSVAFLAGPGGRIPLPAASQVLSSDGRFRYQGGRLPLAPELNQRAQRLAERAVEAIEGLQGYFGVDLVLGDDADCRDDVVIEINPRWTTSYVGLRRLAIKNLAEIVLAVMGNQPLPLLVWRPGGLTFGADGRVAQL